MSTTGFDDLQDLYQEVILEHSNKPRNFRVLECATHSARGNNPLCGDRVTVYFTVENGVIKEAAFQGSGCAISKASSSLMTTVLTGKTVEQAKKMFDGFHDLVTTGKSGDDDLGKLAVFGGVHKYPARVKCAILSWHAVLSALEGKGEIVSTEGDNPSPV